jgi:hypothetical protein
MRNPFEVKSAELMAPEQVAKEFVSEHTENAKLSSFSHTIVWGSRGSGKSMHFKYLEPIAQSYNRTEKTNLSVEKYLTQSDSFLGVYINCRDGILNKDELRLIEKLDDVDHKATTLLLNIYLSCVVIKKILLTIKEQVKGLYNCDLNTAKFPDWLSEINIKNSTKLSEFSEGLEQHCTSLLKNINRTIDEKILNTEYAIPISSFVGHRPRITPDINQFCEFIQQVGKVKTPIFLLFDEANELCLTHQKCINSLISIRSQKTLCIKVASQRNFFQTGIRLLGTVDETHDYTTLDLDGLYTNNREAYYKRLTKISNTRLNQCGFKGDIKDYLPPNQREVNEYQLAIKKAKKRYKDIPQEKRPKDENNFIKKYAPAIIFQEIRSSKSSTTYSGFDNLVHMSSGIVRSFLDCCSKMYNRYKDKYPDKEPMSIPIGIQTEIIREYSNEFIEFQIKSKIKNLEKDSVERQELIKLENLLTGLGKLFRKRLKDKSSREPRIISVSLKDDPNDELQKIIDIAEREAFLHIKWYRSKRGDKNLKCYVLNRRLCPHFNLDLTGFQGRFEVKSEELYISLSDPTAFVKTILNRKSKKEHSHQLTLFDW